MRSTKYILVLFNVSFQSQGSAWSGKGETGQTIDIDISRRGTKSLDW